MSSWQNIKKFFKQKYPLWFKSTDTCKQRFLYLLGLIGLILLDTITFLPILVGVKLASKKHVAPTTLYGFSIMTILLFIITILLGFKLYRHIQNRPTKLKSITSKMSYLHPILLLCLVLVGMMIWQDGASVLMVMVHHTNATANGNEIVDVLRSSPILRWSLMFCSIFLAPVVEELLYRGIFIHLFFGENYTVCSMIFSGLLFGLVHNPTNLISYLIYTGSGVFLAYAYEKSHSLKESAVCHSAFNLITYLL